MASQLSTEQLEQILLAARQDEPTPAEMARYIQIFRQARKTENSLLTQVSQWLRAQLVWDSRDEPLLQGMRNAVQDSYRLRYHVESATIELAIENNGRLRHIEGEIYAEDDEINDLLFDTGPAFITLLRHGEIVGETTADLDGRFGFTNLIAADYAMTLFLGETSRIELVTVNVL